VSPFLCLNSYLYPGFWKVNFEGHLFPHEDVRVASLGEQGLQDIQLCAGERSPLAALFTRVT
jgi:hypothetical protein